jgi:BMFP domain-containing protein YqiC
MIDPKVLDELAHKLANSVPSRLKELQQDVEKNFRSTLQASFARLDLVTREEFDVQSRVLERTREKLERLEQLVEQLENQLQSDQKEI